MTPQEIIEKIHQAAVRKQITVPGGVFACGCEYDNQAETFTVRCGAHQPYFDKETT
jgi:hypothetical protein